MKGEAPSTTIIEREIIPRWVSWIGKGIEKIDILSC